MDDENSEISKIHVSKILIQCINLKIDNYISLQTELTFNKYKQYLIDNFPEHLDIAKGLGIYNIISHCITNNRLIKLLETIFQEKFISRKQITANGLSLYDPIISYIYPKNKTNYEIILNIFNKIIKILHNNEIDIFLLNKYDHTTLGSINTNDNLDKDIKNKLYFMISENISEEQIKKYVKHCFNKYLGDLSDKDNKIIDILRFCFINNCDITCQEIVKCIILLGKLGNKYSLNKYNNFYTKYVDIIVKTLEGFESNYKTTKLFLTDLHNFFKEKGSMMKNPLLIGTILINNVIKYQCNNVESLRVKSCLLGELCRIFDIQNICNKFIITNLENINFEKNDNYKNLIDYSLCCANQSQLYNESIKHAFSNAFVKINDKRAECLILDYLSNKTNLNITKDTIIEWCK